MVVFDVATTSLSFEGPPTDDEHNNDPLRDQVRIIKKLVLGTRELDEGYNYSKEIGIVGVGGYGKTTMFRMVFNRIEDDVDYIIWINLGWILKGEIDFKEILKAMLKHCRDYLMIDDDAIDGVDLVEELLKTLHEALRGKSYLLVFDGVWDINLDWYFRLKETLLLQCLRRIIMIPTRLDGVEKRMVGPNNFFLCYLYL